MVSFNTHFYDLCLTKLSSELCRELSNKNSKNSLLGLSEARGEKIIDDPHYFNFLLCFNPFFVLRSFCPCSVPALLLFAIMFPDVLFLFSFLCPVPSCSVLLLPPPPPPPIWHEAKHPRWRKNQSRRL